jgi:radical SAM-linked protein
MESEAEYLDLDTTALLDPEEAMRQLNTVLPAGLEIAEARTVSTKTPSLSGAISRYAYRITVPENMREGLGVRIEDLLANSSVVVVKEGKQKDIRPGIETMGLEGEERDGTLAVTLVDREQVKPRVQDVVEQLFGPGAAQKPGLRIVRTGLWYQDKGRWRTPLDLS